MKESHILKTEVFKPHLNILISCRLILFKIKCFVLYPEHGIY